MMPHKTIKMFENYQKNNTKSTVYTIALDKFDLSTLTIENYLDKKNNDSKPLWNSGYSNGFYNNNYCEFQIVTKNNVEDDAVSDTEADLNNNKEYSCYICNILVPTNYETEHQKSMKHQMNLKITNNAVERLKKFLNQEVTVREKRKTNPSYYFCESCVLIVKNSDKIKHEHSKEHKISTTQDRLLNDLLNVYLDGGDIIEEFKSNKCNVIIRDHINKDDLLINNNNTKEDINVQTNGGSTTKSNESQIKSDNSKTETDGAIKKTDLEIASDIVLSGSNEASVDKKEKINESTTKKPENEEKKSPLQKYLDKAYEILQNPFVKKFKAFDEDNLEITIGSDVVKVMSDYFHSYSREVNDPNYIICSLCNEIFYEQFVCEHDMKLTHLQNLFLPLNDKNCIRERNAIWSHCIICNLTIGSSSINAHKIDKLHKERLKKSLITTANNEAQKKLQLAILTTPNQKWHCDVCDIHMHINQVDDHIQGRRHQINMDIKKETASAKIENTTANKIVQQIHCHLTKTNSPTTLSCKVCDVNIPNHEKNINEHVNGNNHLANFSLLMMRNKLKQCENGYICEVCGINVSRTSEVGHIGTERHKNNMKIKNINTQKNITTDANIANQHVPKVGHDYCPVCNVEVGIGNMTEHIAGKNHKKKATENANNYYCFICNVYVPRDDVSIKLHENGSLHKSNLNEIVKCLNIPYATKL